MDTEKVSQLLLTEEEQLAKTTIRNLQRTIENQAVTEKILKDELKALQKKLSEVGGVAFDQLNADIEELRAEKKESDLRKANGEKELHRECHFQIQELQRNNKALRRKLELGERRTAKLVRQQNALADYDEYLEERRKFESERDELLLSKQLLESALESEKEKNMAIQIRQLHEQDIRDLREKNRGNTSLMKKMKDKQAEVDDLRKALKKKQTSFVIRESTSTPGEVYIEEIDSVRNASGRQGKVSGVYTARKYAATKISLDLTKEKLKHSTSELLTLKQEYDPLSREVLMLRNQNDVMRRQIQNIRAEYEMKLSLQKSLLTKQTLKSNLYHARIRPSNKIENASASFSVSKVYEKKSLVSDDPKPARFYEIPMVQSTPKVLPQLHADNPDLKSILNAGQMERGRRTPSKRQMWSSLNPPAEPRAAYTA